MSELLHNTSYIDIIKDIKENILKSRYKAATLVNRELLILYFNIGKLISKKAEKEKWGSKVIDKISDDLQKELPGLRGFSSSNIKKMRVFYDEWNSFLAIGSLSMNQMEWYNLLDNQIGSLPMNQFLEMFFSVGFTAHYIILSKSIALEERLFYLHAVATNYWTIETLKYHIKAKLYTQKATLPTNFYKTIEQSDLRAKALNSFKDEYLLDFINIEDPAEENEKLIENEIVRNIKNFIMAFGSDFSFIGNQYQLNVEEQKFYVDLLFFNRSLQALVAIELKSGKFKPEYLGKMNFYLSALDEYVKKPHENPSIGIILCKEKNNKIVEFSFRDFDKSMGVATYKTSNTLPRSLQNVLPDENMFKIEMENRLNTTIKTGKRRGEKVDEKMGNKLTKNQIKIIKNINKNNHITIRELSKKVGIAEKNIEKNIAKLKLFGIVRRIGSARGGHWEVLIDDEKNVE